MAKIKRAQVVQDIDSIRFASLLEAYLHRLEVSGDHYDIYYSTAFKHTGNICYSALVVSR